MYEDCTNAIARRNPGSWSKRIRLLLAKAIELTIWGFLGSRRRFITISKLLEFGGGKLT